jgi:transcriptional regulator with XRE-family HTH domain
MGGLSEFDLRLGEQIGKARTELGMTQEDLGRLVGLSRVAVGQIEAGRRRVSADELQRFSGALEVPADYLVDPAKRPQVTLEQGAAPARQDAGLRISVPQKNVRKFKETLLYLLTRVGGKPNVGETVLYKLLYFIDFDHYERHEEQFIGATYVKREYGPAPVEFQEIARAMTAENELHACEADYYGLRQKRYMALREPDLSVLDGREIQTIEEVVSRLSDMNASKIADYSHKDIPWLVAEEGEILDYESVFYRTPEYSVRPDLG